MGLREINLIAGIGVLVGCHNHSREHSKRCPRLVKGLNHAKVGYILSGKSPPGHSSDLVVKGS